MANGEKKTAINDDIVLTQRVNGLTFGTDAYLLSAFVKGSSNAVQVDLGSGTGIIPLLCATRKKAKKIYAAEIQKKFVSIIDRNAKENGFSDVITAIEADVRELRASDVGCEADIVTANPPYMKVDSGKRNEHDEKFIARHEVFGGISDFCACAYRLLKHGGKFYTVWRPDRLCDLICSLRENKLEPKRIIFVCATDKNDPSMVLVQSTKGAAPGSVVTRPLILHQSREDAAKAILSPDAKEIYDTCSFESFK